MNRLTSAAGPGAALLPPRIRSAQLFFFWEAEPSARCRFPADLRVRARAAGIAAAATAPGDQGRAGRDRGLRIVAGEIGRARRELAGPFRQGQGLAAFVAAVALIELGFVGVGHGLLGMWTWALSGGMRGNPPGPVPLVGRRDGVP